MDASPPIILISGTESSASTCLKERSCSPSAYSILTVSEGEHPCPIFDHDKEHLTDGGNS